MKRKVVIFLFPRVKKSPYHFKKPELSNSDFEHFLDIYSKVNYRVEAIKIAAIYGVAGILWILLSDKLLSILVPDHSAYILLQTYKGWFYVIATMIMVYLLICRRMSLLEKAIKKIYEGYEELSAAHEELTTIEEELRQQYCEIEMQRDSLMVSEQRYSLAVEGANDGIWDWDLNKDIYFFSTKWKSFFGYDADELQGSLEVWKSLLHPEDKEMSIKKVNEYLSSKEGIYENTYRLRCKDGSYRWLLSRGKAVWDKNGKPLRISGSHTDITEHMMLQESLRQQKELTENVINNASLIIVILDTGGNIKAFNPYAESVTGYSNSEVLGKNWTDIFILKHKADEIKRIIKKIVNNEAVNSNESQLVCKDGSILDVLWSNSLLYDNNNNITGIVSLGVNITERKVIEKKLNSLAYYDTLTDLPNRAALEEHMEKLIDLKQHNPSNMALVYMDIDNFKHINDTLGHSYGDELLQFIASKLKYLVEYPDFSARLSGDEFVLVFDNIIDKDDVSNRIEALLKHLRRPWVIENQEFFVSFSMGIALFPDHGEDLATLLKNADTAMFTVKENQKDNYFFYTQAMQEKALRYISMVNQLRHAIENEEFVLFYQPLIDLKTGKMVGVEALIRWHHPERGLVSPAEFIPLAEEAGYIHSIGKWVLRTALSQYKSWLNKGYPSLKISINLSGKRLSKANIVNEIKALSDAIGIECSDIQLEITETAFMENINSVFYILKNLRQMGVKIALDDFGTGYSSLTYLKKLPIDIVKMDREFIKAIIDEDEEEVIVKSVIDLTHSLNLEVVGEGIETEEQMSFLKKYGCDVGQGYLFSRPVPPEDIEKMLESQHNCLKF